MKEETQSNKNHLKNNYLGYIGGPILFTAPHSKKVMRGGKEYGEKQRLHLRQIYTSWLAVQLAHLTKLEKKSGSNSFCVWGKSSQVGEDLDPNYLLESMFPKCSFHLILHKWAEKHKQLPLLHIDVHGKMNRQNNCQIDVGIKSIERHWEGDIILKYFAAYFETFSSIFEGIKFRQFSCEFNTSPALHGYWGGNVHTMTEQAIKLGIPSFQLEIPREVRKKLYKDENLLKNFASGLLGFYKKIIVPYYKEKQKPLKIKKELALGFKETILSQKEAGESRSQLREFEGKEELKLNVKKI